MSSNNTNQSFSSSRNLPSNDGLASLSDPEEIRSVTTIKTFSSPTLLNRNASAASNVPKPRTGTNSPRVQIWSFQQKKPAKNFPKKAIWTTGNAKPTPQQRITAWFSDADFGQKSRQVNHQVLPNGELRMPEEAARERVEVLENDVQLLFPWFISRQREMWRENHVVDNRLRGDLKKERERARVLERNNEKLQKQLEEMEKKNQELEVRLEDQAEVKEAVRNEKAKQKKVRQPKKAPAKPQAASGIKKVATKKAATKKAAPKKAVAKAGVEKKKRNGRK